MISVDNFILARIEEKLFYNFIQVQRTTGVLVDPKIESVNRYEYMTE